MPEARVNVIVSEEDTKLGYELGLDGSQVLEMAINRSLDEQGVPREGREVNVTWAITIQLPEGWWMVDGFTGERLDGEGSE